MSQGWSPNEFAAVCPYSKNDESWDEFIIPSLDGDFDLPDGWKESVGSVVLWHRDREGMEPA